jgi:hypothetical protein
MQPVDILRQADPKRLDELRIGGPCRFHDRMEMIFEKYECQYADIVLFRRECEAVHRRHEFQLRIEHHSSPFPPENQVVELPFPITCMHRPCSSRF